MAHINNTCIQHICCTGIVCCTCIVYMGYRYHKPNEICRHFSTLHLPTVHQPTIQNMYICCRFRKCIRWHIPVYFASYTVIYFSYLFYLVHLPPLGLQTKTKRQSNSSTFCLFKSYNPEIFMSSMVTAFVHVTWETARIHTQHHFCYYQFMCMDSMCTWTTVLNTYMHVHVRHIL